MRPKAGWYAVVLLVFLGAPESPEARSHLPSDPSYLGLELLIPVYDDQADLSSFAFHFLARYRIGEYGRVHGGSPLAMCLQREPTPNRPSESLSRRRRPSDRESLRTRFRDLAAYRLRERCRRPDHRGSRRHGPMGGLLSGCPVRSAWIQPLASGADRSGNPRPAGPHHMDSRRRKRRGSGVLPDCTPFVSSITESPPSSARGSWAVTGSPSRTSIFSIRNSNQFEVEGNLKAGTSRVGLQILVPLDGGLIELLGGDENIVDFVIGIQAGVMLR